MATFVALILLITRHARTPITSLCAAREIEITPCTPLHASPAHILRCLPQSSTFTIGRNCRSWIGSSEVRRVCYAAFGDIYALGQAL